MSVAGNVSNVLPECAIEFRRHLTAYSGGGDHGFHVANAGTCDEPPVRRDDAESKSAQLRTRRLSSLSLARRIVEKAHESKSIS